MIKLYNDDCLNILKDMPDNSVDSLICDPPAFVGFMGQEFDTIDDHLLEYLWKNNLFVNFVERFFGDIAVEQNMDEEKHAQNNANIYYEKINQKLESQENVKSVIKNLHQETTNTASVQGLVLMQQEVLDLLNELCPSLITLLEKQKNHMNTNVAYVIPFLEQVKNHQNTALKSAIKKLKAKNGKAQTIRLTLMDAVKIKNHIAVMIGKKSVNQCMNEMIGLVKCALTNVPIKTEIVQFNAITLSHSNKEEQIKCLTSLLYAYFVIHMQKDDQNYLVNNFFTVIFKEVLRVLKPGAHGLVWALPRTSHWTATALEDAGFEVRDVVNHIFGSGFPKSHNIGKAANDERYDGIGTALKPAWESYILIKKPEELWQQQNVVKKQQNLLDENEKTDTYKSQEWAETFLSIEMLWNNILEENLIEENTFTTKMVSKMIIELKTLKFLISALIQKNIIQDKILINGQVLNVNIAKESLTDSLQPLNGLIDIIVQNNALNRVIFIEVLESLLPRQGSGKEHWILVRKPITEKTVAKNVIKYGTGGINIDACRIATNSKAPFPVGEYSTDTATGKLRDETRSTDERNTARKYRVIDGKLEQWFAQKGVAGAEDRSAVGAGSFGQEGWKVVDEIRQYREIETVNPNHRTSSSNYELGFQGGNGKGLIKKIQSRACVRGVVNGANAYGDYGEVEWEDWNPETLGRFPANIVFSHSDDCDETCAEDCPCFILDKQSGDKCGQNGVVKGNEPSLGNGKIYGDYSMTEPKSAAPKDMLGGASRFFYSAKISTKERNINLESGKNNHPTVKTTKLMSYLIKLITPENGVVLDCFMGSGSTGIAAKECGFGFIGIEKEKEYFDIAGKRIGVNE